MKKLLSWIEIKTDNFTIKRKLIILYVFCVIVPLIITDSVIGGIVFQSEKVNQQHEMENIASAVRYNLSSEIDSAAKYAKSIYTSKYIDEFLKHEYESPLDYYTKYQKFFKDTLLLVLVNVLLPFFMVYCINHSFSVRIRELSEVFDRVEDDQLVEIRNVRGSDEIGGLMRNYNKMVQRLNSLIQIMYKNKIREQEMICQHGLHYYV